MKSANTSECTFRELLENALAVYDTPEDCIRLAMSFIDGLKAGAAQSKDSANIRKGA